MLKFIRLAKNDLKLNATQPKASEDSYGILAPPLNNKSEQRKLA